MFYSWTDIENQGYDNIEDFAKEEMRHPDYEGATITSEGIEIKRRQRLSDFRPAPSVKKRSAKCKIFPAMGLEQTESAFNSFCENNNIQSEDIIKVSYKDGRIFLVYQEN